MAAYIKFDGIDGESKDKSHQGWSDLGSFRQEISRPGAGATGAARRRGTVTHPDLECSKLLDKSSPKIAEAVLKGKVFPKVEIQLTTSTTDSGRETYYKYTLENVLVTSYQVQGSAGAHTTESFLLNFEQIKSTYTEMDEKGTKKGAVAYGWDVEKGQSA
ncbi:MAG: type VI secretion system tube protein Hcp [Pirellulales bacterium]